MAATAQQLAACVWMCVRVCVHCGQLEPAVLPEKTAFNSVEISANASQKAKKILALRGVALRRHATKKS